jgi:putative transcriptional regulator
MAIVKNNIRSILETKGLKQKFVADKAGISEQTLSNCINERFDISLNIAFQIARALEMKLEEIFTFEEDIDNL